MGGLSPHEFHMLPLRSLLLYIVGFHILCQGAKSQWNQKAAPL